jgi:hypothetical protein
MSADLNRLREFVFIGVNTDDSDVVEGEADQDGRHADTA